MGYDIAMGPNARVPLEAACIILGWKNSVYLFFATW